MEEWRDLSNFKNHQVSNEGRIRNKKNGHVLKHLLDKDGYPRLSIGSVDNVPIHRLVCETFNGPPTAERNQVNHIDANRQNNFADNLEWCTPSENIKWGVDHGHVDPYKGLKRAAEVNPKPVRIIETGQIFNSVKECAEHFNVRPTNVSRVITGARKGQKFHGYHLEHVEKETRENE